ncbi:hypothetical protein CEV33_3213 [Brucella grignonensis]|uniref:Uncharacterized protein n=1 Tax=Brucella grignonensis TaxID=94627 RepID=A0A256F0U9_9HYPH|nr:hypothetical protein CEV33_3213 [Brucella grignonensis]
MGSRDKEAIRQANEGDRNIALKMEESSTFFKKSTIIRKIKSLL